MEMRTHHAFMVGLRAKFVTLSCLGYASECKGYITLKFCAWQVICGICAQDVFFGVQASRATRRGRKIGGGEGGGALWGGLADGCRVILAGR